MKSIKPILVRRLAIMLMAGASVASLPAMADDATVESRLRDQLRQTITQLREVQDENFSLKSKITALSSQIVTPEEQARQQAQLQQSRAEALHAAQTSGSLKRDLEQTKQMLSDAQAGIAARDVTLHQQAEALQESTNHAEALQVQGNSCEAKNRQLTALFDEVLQQFQDRGVFDALLAREPLTGLKRAQLERLTEDYRARADALGPAAAVPVAQP